VNLPARPPAFPRLDAAAIAALRGRSLLTTLDFSDTEVDALL